MPKRPPFNNRKLGRSYVLRLSPFEPTTSDITRPWEPDEALWLFEGAMDDRTVAPYAEVWDYCASFSETPAMVSVLWAIWHPDTPFGVGYDLGQRSPDLAMIVMWRGMVYTRDRRGVLTPTGQTVFPHPSPREWWDGIAAFHAWKREQAAT